MGTSMKSKSGSGCHSHMIFIHMHIISWPTNGIMTNGASMPWRLFITTSVLLSCIIPPCYIFICIKIFSSQRLTRCMSFTGSSYSCVHTMTEQNSSCLERFCRDKIILLFYTCQILHCMSSLLEQRRHFVCSYYIFLSFLPCFLASYCISYSWWHQGARKKLGNALNMLCKHRTHHRNE